MSKKILDYLDKFEKKINSMSNEELFETFSKINTNLEYAFLENFITNKNSLEDNLEVMKQNGYIRDYKIDYKKGEIHYTLNSGIDYITVDLSIEDIKE
jgi:ribosomal protein S8